MGKESLGEGINFGGESEASFLGAKRKAAKGGEVKMVKGACGMKAEEVQRWFLKHVTYEGEAYAIDLEQAEAVADESFNTIVTARAGSGKTRTIVAKIIYLVARKGVKPEEIMAFVFNANAAAEINARLSKMLVDNNSIISDARIASTFHAFSRDIVYNIYGGKEKCRDILADEKEAFILYILEMMRRGKRAAELGLDEKMSDEAKEALARRLTTFVNRAQQSYLAGENTLAENVEARLKAPDLEADEREFILQGAECYRLYHFLLLRGTEKQKGRFSRYGTDFNLIVAWAGRLISERAEEAVSILAGKKYILIDEYQDFSQLFLSVVMAIRRAAKEARLFVVGDDLQAINRFAGSEVRYFTEFERYFPGARRLEIATNYRCDYMVVQTARKFMKKAMGDRGGFRAFSRRPGRVILVPAEMAGVLDIIIQEREAEEILILHRNNEPLEFLRPKLKREVLREIPKYPFDERVKMMTMHKSKGLEAEVVIILDADEGVIPKMHPDTRLYTMFGETEEVALEDQKRLFYVAMTRAKKRLYIIHNKKHGAGFIKFLGRGLEKWEE